MDAGEEPTGRRPRGSRGPRVLRVLRIVGLGLAALVGLLGLLVAGALLYVESPPGRRFAAAQVNRLLAQSFQGRIHIESLDKLGIYGVGGANATLFDPKGRPVLIVRGLRVRIAPFALVRSALFGKHEPLTVGLFDASIDDLDVRLDTDEAGQLDLVDAFAPKTQGPPTPPDPDARGVRVDIDRILLKHGWAHGNLTGSPALDANVDDLHGSFSYSPDGLRGALERADILARRIANGADVAGRLEGKVEAPSSPSAPLAAHAVWHGTAGTLAHSLEASLEKNKLDAVLDAPAFDAASVRTLWPASPLQSPASLHFEAHGTLPAVDFDLRSSLGQTRVTAGGHVLLGQDDSTKDLRAHADVRVVQPSASAHGSLDISPKGKSYRLDAALEAEAPHLERVPELKNAVAGSVQAVGRGSLDLDSMSVDAHLQAAAANLVAGSTRIDSATATLHAWGPLADPSLDVAVQGRGLVAGGRHMSTFHVAAKGTEKSAHVVVATEGSDIPTTDASADVDLEQGIALRSLHVELARAGERATVTAASLRTGDGALRVEGGRIEGLGWPASVSFEQRGEALHVRASSAGIDLGRVARLGHIEDTLTSGTLSLDTDVTLAPGRAAGKVMVDLAGVSASDFHDLSAHVELTVHGSEVAGKVHASSPDLGSIDLDMPKLVLGGMGWLSPTSWRQAWGHVSFDGVADLAAVLERIPADQRPFGEASGKLTLKGEIRRASPADLTPNLTLSFKTEGLSLAPNTPRSRDIDGVMVVGPPAWHLQGVDFDGDFAARGDTQRIELQTRIRDQKGLLTQVSVTLPHFPYGDALVAPARLENDARTVPFDIRVNVPERGLGGLPDLLKQEAVMGKVTVDLHATGTMLAPQIALTAALRDPHFSDQTQTLPTVHMAAHYDGRGGTLSVKAGPDDNPVVDVEATFDAALAQFLGPSEKHWTASAKGHFADFPLGAIPALDADLVSGKLTGDFTLEGLHKNARLDADLGIAELRVGNVKYKAAHLKGKADGRSLDGTLHIDQVDGFVDATAHAVAPWGSTVVPTLDPKQPVAVQLTSKNFRIAALLPLVSQSLDELDGRLDSAMQVSLEPGTAGAKLSGTMTLTRGLIEASAGGGELHDVSASIRFDPSGTVIVDHLRASGLSGRVEGSASARFDGTRFQAAKAVLVIPARSAIPVTANGTEIGNVEGRIEVSANAGDNGSLVLGVQIPHLHVALPEGSSPDVQSLGTMNRVHIGAHKGSRTSLLLVPLDPVKQEAAESSSLQNDITVHIGNIVVQRGTDLKVELNGTLHVKSGAKTDVTGQIQLNKGGMLNVQGRSFEVEGGTVTFTGGDPSNPEIVVKASWTAQDGTVVTANFVGPLKTGKVTLSSEPTLPKQEIVELLLYGTSTGQQAQAPPESTQNTAIATAGGEAAQPLNHALNQLGLGAVTAKVDTSESSNPKPEIEVQIAKGISVQLAYVLGVPPPGVNPDSTLVSLDWRFLSKWSLESTLGDAGTTIFDLIWQSRY